MGFLAYKNIASTTVTRAIQAFQYIGIPKFSKLKMDVSTSSVAETNVLQTELNRWIKSDFAILIKSLPITIANTKPSKLCDRGIMLKFGWNELSPLL